MLSSSHLAHWASHKRRCFAHPLQHESLRPSKAQNPKKSCQLQVGHEDSIARVGKNWRQVGDFWGHPIPSHPSHHPTIRSLWSKTLDSCCIRSSSKKSAGFGEPGAVFGIFEGQVAVNRLKSGNDVGWCWLMFFLISLPSIAIQHRGHHNLLPSESRALTRQPFLEDTNHCFGLLLIVPGMSPESPHRECSYGSKDSKETICMNPDHSGSLLKTEYGVPKNHCKPPLVFHVEKDVFGKKTSLTASFVTSLRAWLQVLDVLIVVIFIILGDDRVWCHPKSFACQMKTCENLIVSTCDMSILCQLCLTMRKFT